MHLTPHWMNLPQIHYINQVTIPVDITIPTHAHHYIYLYFYTMMTQRYSQLSGPVRTQHIKSNLYPIPEASPLSLVLTQWYSCIFWWLTTFLDNSWPLLSWRHYKITIYTPVLRLPLYVTHFNICYTSPTYHLRPLKITPKNSPKKDVPTYVQSCIHVMSLSCI